MVASMLSAMLVSSLATVTVAQWTSSGCYADTGANRPLKVSVIPSTTQDTTIENCQAACQARNYPYAGVENGYQCWCDNSIATGAVAGAAALCNVACFGNAAETCGGDSAMAISHNGAIVPIITVTATYTAPGSTPPPIVTFSTVTITQTVAPPTAPPPTTRPRPTSTRPQPRPTSTSIVCDTQICCYLYPDYCNNKLYMSADAVPTAVAERDAQWQSIVNQWTGVPAQYTGIPAEYTGIPGQYMSSINGQINSVTGIPGQYMSSIGSVAGQYTSLPGQYTNNPGQAQPTTVAPVPPPGQTPGQAPGQTPGQVQNPGAGQPVTQISDGQVQAPTPGPSTIAPAYPTPYPSSGQIVPPNTPVPGVTPTYFSSTPIIAPTATPVYTGSASKLSVAWGVGAVGIVAALW